MTKPIPEDGSALLKNVMVLNNRHCKIVNHSISKAIQLINIQIYTRGHAQIILWPNLFVGLALNSSKIDN